MLPALAEPQLSDGEKAVDHIPRPARRVALVVGHLSLALADASSDASRLLARGRKTFWIIGGRLTVLTLTLTVPPLASILDFTIPAWPLLVLAIALGVAAGGWFGLVRRLRPLPAA